MNAFSHWQVKRFINRKRNENPELQTSKILGDDYLLYIYQQNLEKMLNTPFRKIEQNQRIVELGSAGGVTKQIYPNILTTDVRKSKYVDEVVDSQDLPFQSNSIDVYLAKDMLHHLPNSHSHFAEVARTLKSGGVAVYLEPNWNLLSKVVFSFFHPEPYLPGVKDWEFDSLEPMFANQALAWIIFKRDPEIWSTKFSNLRYVIGESTTGIDFLISGGVYSRNSITKGFLLMCKLLAEKLKVAKYFEVARIIYVVKV